MHSSDAPIPKYSELVYNGFWFSPEREALQALITETQRDVTRLVRLKLYKGNVIFAGRKSPKSLYDPKIATMEGDASAYDQSDATGFSRLNTLRLRLRAAMRPPWTEQFELAHRELVRSGAVAHVRANLDEVVLARLGRDGKCQICTRRAGSLPILSD